MEEIQIVEFTLGEEIYAIPISNVKEIIKFTKVTSIPKTCPNVQGIINLRGKIVTIINLASKLGLVSNVEKNIDGRVIIVESNDLIMGFEVDGVSEVLRITTDQIEPPPDIALQDKFLTGMGKVNGKLLLLLNVEALVSR
ncbi:MAG: chemotaxis protein CheW [Desulfitobacteriaceae bacterium]